MPTTLTYGRKIPLTGERGTWWTNLEANTTLDDAHTHNGVNSAAISAANIAKNVQNVAAGSWAAVASETGTFSQTITFPAGYLYSTGLSIKFYIDGGDGSELFLSMEKASDSTAVIYINDNSLALKAVYA